MGGHTSRWPWALETMSGLNPVSDSAFTSALFFTCDATRRAFDAKTRERETQREEWWGGICEKRRMLTHQ